MDTVKINPDAAFVKDYNSLSIDIAEENLPSKNYDNITIECIKIESNEKKNSTCLPIKSKITADLRCKCDLLEIATKYHVRILTIKKNWTSQALDMEDQYTSRNNNKLN